MGWFRQLYALLWKNFLIKRRAWVTTLFEIILPVLVMLIMLAIRSAVSKSNNPPSDHLVDMCPLNTTVGYDPCDYTLYPAQPRVPGFWMNGDNRGSMIAFAPSSPSVLDLVSSFKQQYPRLVNRTKIFDSDDSIESYCTDINYGVPGTNPPRPFLLAAVVINSFGSSSKPQWKYTIRLNATGTLTTPDPLQTDAVNTKHNTYDATNQLMLGYRGHMFLQNFVENFILMNTTGVAITPTSRSFSVAPFPTPQYISDRFIQAVSNLLGFFFTLVYIWPVTRLVKSIVEEKETRIKEGMKMMGLSESVLWLSWVITYAILFFITAILLMLVCMGSIFPNSDRGRVFFFFWMFGLSVIAFCYFISVFFSRATIASTIGAVIFLASFFPYYAVNSPTTSPGSKMLASLSPPIAFALGSVVFADYESTETGVNDQNAGTDFENFSYNRTIAMLIVDFIIYTALSVYLSRVVRSEWGTALPWYYPCMPSFWCPRDIKRPDPSRAPADDGVQHIELKEKIPQDNDHFEPVASEIRKNAAVIIRHLKKVFQVGDSDPQLAVKDLNLDLYTGQILALLGHNGAGKTTTINMLTGMMPPSDGDAHVFGKSIVHDMESIRTILGVCPQHNILFNELTVEEHLRLFCHIKGVPWELMDSQIKEMIEQVGLVEKVNYRSGALSGGMQRKLSVGIALIGDSKIIFLDEPTSGMDPYSRRATWDLLKRKKEGRVMILTTHFMDEADQLGDRIAIMAKGDIKCCGSSLFLKSRYGVGYTMTISKRDNFDALTVPRLVKLHISDSEPLSNVAGEISFRLPLHASKQFAPLFDEFDAKQDELGIDSYGVSVTTLEEVFLRVGRDEELNPAQRQETKHKLVRLNSESRARRLSQSKNKPATRPEGDRTLDVHDDDTDVSIHPAKDHEEMKNMSFEVRSSDAAPSAVTVQVSEATPTLAKPKNYDDDDEMDSLGTLKLNEDPALMFARHFRALLIKRWFNARRDTKVWTWTIIYPIILLLFIGLLQLPQGARPDLTLSVTQYNTPAPTPFGYFTVVANSANNVSAPVFPNPSVNPDAIAINLFQLSSNVLNQATATGFESFKAAKASDILKSDLQNPILNSQFYAAYQMNNYLMSTMLQKTDPYNLKDPGMILSRYNALMANVNTDNNTLSDQFVIMVNSTATYGLPIGLNLYNQYLLQMLTNTSSASIELHSHAFPRTAQQKTLITSVGSLFISAGFAFIPSSFVGYSVREEADKVKHQQLISGVSIFAYWISQYVWDFANFMVPGFLSMIVYEIFGIDGLIGENAGGTILLVILFGLAVIPFSYCCSFLFQNATSAQSIMLIVFILAGALLGVASGVLDFIGGSTKDVNQQLKFMYRLLPPFCFAEGISNMLTRSTTLLWGTPRSLWDIEILGYPMIYLTWETFFFFACVLIIEKIRSTPEIINKVFPPAEAPYREFPDEDADVTSEKKRLQNAPIPDMVNNKEIISIRGLRKVYGGRMGQNNAKIAVHDLWLGIPEGQCFGYLGINGAGKTTTLKMLTADILPSAGTAYLNGMDINSEQANIRRLLGYCPQFDALIGSLTAREHLFLFARIKGVDEAKIPVYVEKLIQKIGLQEGIADKPSSGYSGGNKRKLCVGIALIGNPPIVFLDEPSTGMDPGSRRFMWDLIASTMAGRSVILTTHSMEECEALCQSIGIMVGGRLRCVGSAQHLKSVHGSGFQVDAHVGSVELSVSFKDFLIENFPGSKLIEEHGENVKYRIPKECNGMRVTIANMFRTLEANKEKFGITDYSVSETTLEQIFIHFAKQQEEETGHVAGIQ